MILYGYGGHGRVIADCLESRGETVDLVFEDAPAIENCPFPLFLHYNPAVLGGKKIILAVGDNYIRKRLSGLIKHQPGIVVHPSSIISPAATIEEGTVVLQRAIVQHSARIGKHCIINSGAIVEHDSSLGNFVHIAPGAIICGSVEVGACTLIGAGAVILPGLKIGKNCIIGAGSVVLTSVPDGVHMAGNPARLIKKNCAVQD